MLSLLVLLLGITARVRGQLTGNETCESTSQLAHIDWDDLMSDDTLKPDMTYTLSVIQTELRLVIDAELEYVGYSYADAHTYGYGTTYVLDFEDFNANSDNIREPGNCQNRVSGDFSGSFPSLWTYSKTPAQTNHLGNESYLAYPPPSEHWSLTIDAVNECTPIKYHGEFDWAELRDCGNYAGDDLYTGIKVDANWINMSGVFYINMVSPLAHYTDTGYYRVFQMLSAPFVMAVRNTVNFISSVGINLFTLSIIAVFKDDLESDFTIILLSESADFLMLSAPTLLSSPTFSPSLNLQVATDSVNSGCLVASASLCSQLWHISAANVTCPPTDFTGQYALDFTTTCNSNVNYTNGTKFCNDYITQYGSDVGLTVDLEWLDEICDPQVFVMQFAATMNFYDDSNFVNQLGATDQYALEDTAYVELSIIAPENFQFNIFDVNLDAVWVCTTSPENEPLSVTNQNLGAGGCLSGTIDADSLWHIVQSGAENDLTAGGDVTLYTPYNNATMRFSFFVSPSIVRTNLWIHAQVSIDLVSEGGERRRMRALLETDDVDTASQTRHFNAVAGINHDAVIPVDDDGDVDVESTETITWMKLAVGVGLVNVCLISICLFCFWFGKRKGAQKTEDIAAVIVKKMEAEKNSNSKQNSIDVVYGRSRVNTESVGTSNKGHDTPQSNAENGIEFPASIN